MTAPDFKLKAFKVRVTGWPELSYFAATRGQAIAQAFRDYTSTFDCTFRDFLKLAHASGAVVDNPRFGEEMTVGGQRAFYVSHNSQYIQFVRPDSGQVFNTHPLDVEPPEARRGTPYYRPEAA